MGFEHIPQAKFNNAAGRLHVVLELLKTQEAGWATHIAWRRALFDGQANLHPDTKIEASEWQRLAQLTTLLYQSVVEIEEQISTQAEHPEVFLKEFPNLKKIISPINFEAPFDHYHRLITGELLARLETCAMALAKEEIVEPDELQEIYQQATDLFNEIEQAEMPKKLRKYLLSLVDGVRDAIAQFKIHGAKGVEEALARFVGGITIKQAEILQLPGKDSIMQKAGKLWSHLAMVARFVSDTRKIVEMSELASPTAYLAAEQLLKITGQQ